MAYKYKNGNKYGGSGNAKPLLDKIAKVENEISDAWTQRTYEAGEYAIDGNILWKCLVTNSERPSEGANWHQVTVMSEVNSGLTALNSKLDKTVVASYGGFTLYKSNGIYHYKSDFTMNANLNANSMNAINNTQWNVPEIVTPLVFPVRMQSVSTSTQVGMGFWVVLNNGLYFVPLVATTQPVYLRGADTF